MRRDICQGNFPKSPISASVERLIEFPDALGYGGKEGENMLAEWDRVKSYIGQDVILATPPPEGEIGKLVIAVGHLYDHAFLSDIPFGTAGMMGVAKFTVDLGADEYRRSDGSWTFSTQQKLDEWASDLPARLDFVDLSLPADAQIEEIRNVFAIAPLQPGVKEKYFAIANELFLSNSEQQ